jgi:hypothetical protein
MDKASSFPSTDLVENAEPVTNDDRKLSLAKADVEAEHQLTFRDVWKHHKAIIGWSFFWAMCAIGWFVLLSSPLFPQIFGANLCNRGFDAQVNGAMIGVPSFRRDFGRVSSFRRNKDELGLTDRTDTSSMARRSFLQTGNLHSTSSVLWDNLLEGLSVVGSQTKQAGSPAWPSASCSALLP